MNDDRYYLDQWLNSNFLYPDDIPGMPIKYHGVAGMKNAALEYRELLEEREAA